MIEAYITRPTVFPMEAEEPWRIVENLCESITHLIETLDDEFDVKDGVAIHQSAIIGHNVTIKAPAIISANCFVGSNSYLRGGVFLAPGAKVGISCEVKTSVLLEGCAIAHFNFVGDSIIGHDVNIEAGAILCNHYNEREDDTVYVAQYGKVYHTSLSCSHLTISVTNPNQVQKVLGSNHYRKCEKCIRAGQQPAQLYYTKYGDCYHSTLSCSGLKRSVRLMKKSEISGMRICSECGKKHGKK